ncbi:glutamine--tRNA ligase/YqeY domain fusion protein [Chitinophaga solisilvae]|uniref:glutamine--tRNA ligase/YqeY domain fusion protein n=1 Tax=Chitinophaga solisilvae TaxID=1233460 RepID=UPI00136C451E|nr:glutamine--tRNA ligase/YqeY domain fusion protein [Chitinophaga solisilvae]
MSEERSLNFIEQIVEEDIANGVNDGRVLTRFPPEPNGYLHIGHAKSIVVNFGIAQQYNGKTNLRFDDTNPVTEDTEYVESIKADIKWLGFTWDKELYASDYFEQLYAFAVKMIEKGLAYVEDATAEEIAAAKGTPTTPGTPTPARSRSVAENLDLFQRMRNGEFKDGEKTLRAKIDLASPNMHMRDPLMYRIKHAHHHRTGDKWCIYPMYDFAHGQSDSIEQITHSLCTLEFIPHRPLYEWFINELEIFPSHQYEFARFNMSYTVMSKRKLKQLVEEKIVAGWDDPRMPTLSGLRRRGYTPSSIRNLCERVGLQKREYMIDFSLLEFCIREELNKSANRVMAVLDPVKLVITNYPADKVEILTAENNPEDESAGSRQLYFSNTLYIEREDFMENPPKKFFRLGPGLVVRLKNAYVIQGESVEKDADGNITTIYATYLPGTKSGEENSNMTVKGTIHWVSAEHAASAEVRLYDRLFTSENPGSEEGDFKTFINPDSLQVIRNAMVEPALLQASPGDRFQFMRKGYFTVDADSTPEKVVFNRTVTLKDAWAKEKAKS